MVKKTQVKVEPPKKTRTGAPKLLPLPTKEEAFAVYIELQGSVYATHQHYIRTAAQLGYRVPAETTVHNWEKRYNWKEKLAKHAEDVEKNLAAQHIAVSTRKVLDARKEVENICELIFKKLSDVIPDLEIKTATDVRQLGLVTKDYLEIRDRIEGTGADKAAEEVAKTAELRVQEASRQSEALFAQLEKAYIPDQRPN